jgi:hypothetical protein
LGDIIYDRERKPWQDVEVPGISVKYDSGYKYDMRFGPQGKPEDIDYSIYETAECHDVCET